MDTNHVSPLLFVWKVSSAVQVLYVFIKALVVQN